MAATVQQIEDAIRKLAAKNPKDPGIATLAKARSDMLSGGAGGAAAPAEEPGMWDTFADAAIETGLNTRHAVTERPLQSLFQDLPRSVGSFTSFGMNDRLRSMATGTPIEEEVAKTNEADTRLGTWDDAINLGLSVAMPFQGAYKYAPEVAEGVEGAAKYGPKLWGAAKKAIGYGAEGAGQSAVQAAVEGRPVGESALWGAAGGAGGSVGADVVGSVANVFKRKARPQYASEDALQSASQSVNLNTKSGRKKGEEVVDRNALVDQVRLAETKGPGAFRELSDRLEGAGRNPKFPREVYEGISKAGTPKSSAVKRGLANVLDFGGGWGKLASTKVSPLLPLGAAALRTSADIGGDLDAKTVQKVKALLLRGSVDKAGPTMSPEMKNELRHYLAKIGSNTARTKQ